VLEYRGAAKAKFHYASWFGASSELAPNMFGASSEPASVMEFGFYRRLDTRHDIVAACTQQWNYKSLLFANCWYGWPCLTDGMAERALARTEHLLSPSPLLRGGLS